MKSYSNPFIYLPVAMTMALLAACNDSNNGGDDPNSVTESLPAGTFVKTVSGAAEVVDSNLFGTTTSTRRQHLHYASEIGAAGYITKIGFRRNDSQPNSVACAPYTIAFAHTDNDALTTTPDANLETGEGSLVTVFDNGNVTIPAGEAGEFFDITLHKPFYYNGKDNLIVDLQRSASCTDDVNVAYMSTQSATTYSDDNGAAEQKSPHTRFEFAGGDALIEPGTSTATASYPFDPLVDARHVQLLYTAEEVGGQGPIAGIALINDSETDIERSYTVDVLLSHTDAMGLEATLSQNINIGEPETVASNLDFVIPAGMPAGALVWLPMTATFNYNGTDNLLVDIKVTSDSQNSPFLFRTSENMSARRVYAALSDAVGTVDNFAYDIAVRFHGSKVGVLRTASTDSDALNGNAEFPLGTGGTPRRRQHLYRSVELGGAGEITKLACRIGDIDSASLQATYTVVMSHTTHTSLNTDFTTNLMDPVTVYTKQADVPELKQGDWFELNLSTPFAYNGHDNLIVDITGESTENAGGCLVDWGSPTLNKDRMVQSDNDPLALTGDLQSRLPDMLFDIRR